LDCCAGLGNPLTLVADTLTGGPAFEGAVRIENRADMRHPFARAHRAPPKKLGRSELGCPTALDDAGRRRKEQETGTDPMVGSPACDGSDRSPWFTGRLCSKIEVCVSSLLSNRMWVAATRRPGAAPILGPPSRPRRPAPGGTRPQRGNVSTLPPERRSRWNTPGPGGSPQHRYAGSSTTRRAASSGGFPASVHES